MAVESVSVVPPHVEAMKTPVLEKIAGGFGQAISSSSKEAQDHVNQGLDHLHAGWEFEACRNFSAAAKLDPNCLMAHWGIVMSTFSQTPETRAASDAAALRMVELIESGAGSGLERGYAYGLMKYLETGPSEAANAFHKVAKEFPNDIQAPIFAALFGRAGYDAEGAPLPDEEAAQKQLEKLAGAQPENPVPVHALLSMRAEAGDLTPFLADARRLVAMRPGYAPYLHLLGHYEWRCGNHPQAVEAFSNASASYQSWMGRNDATLADCPEFLRSESYRVVAMNSTGDFDKAYIEARQLAALPYPENRPDSAGLRMMLWETKTLPARLLLDRDKPGNAQEAAASLPSVNEVKPFRQHCLAYWWIDGLRISLDARRLINLGKLEQARFSIDALTNHGESMAANQDLAKVTGERSEWVRSFKALEVIASDLRGLLALKGPKSGRGSAYNWFASAAERQQRATMLHPPLLLTPMHNRLGFYHLETGETEKAIGNFSRALADRPGDPRALKGLESARSR